MRIHKAAEQGFGSAAGEYERSRPDYPAEAVAHLAATLGIAPGRSVVDLACGTGKMTRLLQPYGSSLTGVDPVESMLAQFRVALPEVPVLAGTAEDLPLSTGSVDAVVVAQGFHWFDGDRALESLHRVLRPGGMLGLIWNVRDESMSWVARLGEVFRDYEDAEGVDVLRFWRGAWKPAFDRSVLFEPLVRQDFRHEQTLTPDGAVDRVLSVSFIAIQPPDVRQTVVDRVREIIATDPETRNRDTFPLPYVVHAYTTSAL